MHDIEYLPQRRIGIQALVRGCVAAVFAAMFFVLAPRSLAFIFFALFAAAVAIAWFVAYGAERRRRCRLTATALETRQLRTRLIPWAQIRDVQVVKRVTVAAVPVRGSHAAGRYGSRSGGGARKIASVRVQRANGRWLELAMPVAWENAPDPDFASKANVIQSRWRAATGQLPVG